MRRSPIPQVPFLYPLVLDALRRRAQNFGVLHAWHSSPDDVDNDLYLRLGVIDPAPDTSARVAAEERLRDVLAAQEPVLVDLTAKELAVVSYVDRTLPPASSRVRPVLDDWNQAEVDALFA